MLPTENTKGKTGGNNRYRGDLFESLSRKEKALANHEANRGRILLQARHAFLNHLLQHKTVTADDIRGKFEIPDGVNPACLGSVPGIFARGLVIRRCGYVESLRPEAHARVLSLWELLNREKAEAWLRDNPLAKSEVAK